METNVLIKARKHNPQLLFVCLWENRFRIQLNFIVIIDGFIKDYSLLARGCRALVLSGLRVRYSAKQNAMLVMNQTNKWIYNAIGTQCRGTMWVSYITDLTLKVELNRSNIHIKQRTSWINKRTNSRADVLCVKIRKKDNRISWNLNNLEFERPTFLQTI